MADPQDTRFDRLEALIGGIAESMAARAEDVADTQIALMEVRHQLEVKDTQIAALLERVKEANILTAKAFERNGSSQIAALLERLKADIITTKAS